MIQKLYRRQVSTSVSSGLLLSGRNCTQFIKYKNNMSALLNYT